MLITKTDFLNFKKCEAAFWFSKFQPEALTEPVKDDFIERLKQQGVLVELFARGIFPEAVLVEGKLAAAAKETETLIKDGLKQIFQASFMVDDLFSACDVLVRNDMLDGWDIIEIKSSTDKNKKKEEHIFDAAFQRLLLEKAGLKVVNVYLLELNKNYYKKGKIDLDQMFNFTEITTECIEIEPQLTAEIQDAKNLLNLKTPPTDCSCKYKGKSKHCRAFKQLYPQVPEYSIYNLRAIGTSKKVLANLVDCNHLAIEDIPSGIKLSVSHEKQRWVTATKETIFDKESIQAQFDKLSFPLYFLDYETLALGIPKYENTYAYQQTVFQYSLHILHEDGNIIHKEYIHPKAATPIYIVAKKLREDIGDTGSVIVWNKGFEMTCNKDLAKVNPELEQFLLGVNARVYDLMEVFQKMQYLNHELKGSYSIKNVLPILCPQLSYETLAVSNGIQAVVEYENLIFGDVPEEEKEQKFLDLLAYCELDTLAMVKIYEELLAMLAA